MEDRCVICGEIVPEGGQICRACFLESQAKMRNFDKILHNEWVKCMLGDNVNYIKNEYAKIKENNQSAKADAGKPRLSLVPTEIISCIARVREFGNKKYKDADSWKRVEKERYRDAMFRHLIAYIDNPSGKDDESGLPHLWHLACNVAFLCEMEKDKE